MNEHATRSQAVASAIENIKLNMSLTEFEQLLDGAIAAPEGERSEEWIALVAPGADADTRRRLVTAYASWAEAAKAQARQPVSARLAALRKELASQQLDGFLVPRADEHQGEYVPKRAERLAWISNFTGSAGLAVVLKDKAAIFVDGRYTIQVREQVDAQLFEIRHLINEPPEAWIAGTLKKGEILGFDPWLITPDAAQRYREAARKAGAELKAVDRNPLDAAWADQPPEPIAPIWPQDTRHAGMSAGEKRQLIASKLKEKGQDAAVISAPDSLAWLLNIRGGDVPRTPFALGYAIVDKEGKVDLFVDPRKLTQEARAHLGNEIAVQPKSGFVPALDSLGKQGAVVAVDAMTAGVAIFDRLKAAGAKPAVGEDPCALPKACKNPVEIEGARAAHRRDGAAVSQFLHWLSIEAPKGGLDEIAAAERLAEFRRRNDLFRDFSFDTISAAGPNGAICHYKVTEKSNRPIPVNWLYLVDSGGQYLDGTTDITRTIAVGQVTQEMKDRFTRVLKGHIALATTRFPRGTTGSALDSIARRPLWEVGLDYDHGTGHGVGSYLSVHEGPQRISKMPNRVTLDVGMIISNEPGYYKDGEYGIRIENLVTVIEDKQHPGMLCFETLTLAPIDLNAIDRSLLTADEVAWLNAYHERVRQTIKPLVDPATAKWLEGAARAI
ncbi:aminopeptidase P family protein [Dongia deserti]|uniref:aminopeptidase P family protein n=1 Tax=Dongia deserti TaxID=2268030 RepID=UPI00254680E3|nr:aminopeptidase P family protein [Dongia deserti]